jgi:phenylacetate-CoA ligase
MYSTQETGYIALQCPDSENYHIQSECALVEILDAEGVPCQAGEIGRVVVTPLHNFATPLLRYDIGDYAEVGAPCPCGRGLPVLTRIMGRARAMLALPNGGRSWPLMGGSRFAEIAPVRQYQFVQKTPEKIEARLVLERALTVQEEEALRERMLTRLGHPFEINFRYVDQIARKAGGKYEESKSEL